MKVDELKLALQKRNISVEQLADILNIDKSSVYRKFNRRNKSFTVEEASKIVQALHLSKKDANSIFFDY